MKQTALSTIGFIALTSLALASPALAAGDHAGGHGHNKAMEQDHAGGHGHGNDDGHHEMMAVGKPGGQADARRTVQITMQETDGGEMLFQHSSVTVKKGETVRFTIINKGELEHEFVLDEHEKIMEHKALMEKFPDMEHDDPNSIRLEPGKKGEIIWTFTNSGTFEFACLIPGHYDAGMKGTLTVGAK